MVISYEMKWCRVDHSVFVRHNSYGYIILAIYVDENVITCSDVKGISKLKDFIGLHFHTKYLRRIQMFSWGRSC